jgi:arylsulfatase
MLRPLGYRSYHSGKWHLDGQPTANGFDRSYYLEDCGRYFQPRVHYEDDVRLPPPPAASGYYATSAIAEHAIGYLQEHARLRGAQPFFLYLCFTAPHFPLQALPQDIARYRDVYLRGWDQTRQARWQRMTATGLVRHALPPWERGVGPPYHFPEALRQLGASETNRPVAWAELSETQQRFQAAKMAVHAAMIDRMDRAIGLVLDQLRSMGAWENTLILFLSDNGASAELMVRDDGHDPAASPGSAATHLCLGPGWSTVANTPFRRHKTWVHEGGIATSFIAHWPSGIAARGELRHTPGHVIDLVPTILELAGGAPAKTWAGQPVPPAPGQSLVPLFRKDGTVRHAYFWWQHEGNRALRLGDWKLVAAGENAPWELYHLRTDRGETQNLASRQPARAAKLAAFWQRQFEEFHRLARSDLRTNAVTRDAAPPGN